MVARLTDEAFDDLLMSAREAGYIHIAGPGDCAYSQCPACGQYQGGDHPWPVGRPLGPTGNRPLYARSDRRNDSDDS